ncbi:peptidylprolyl isomerase [Mycena sp. CBHHK59/15]|nr:peptidylprolyl isomerase [Mycena sp. CBHHK59/15]
MTTIGLWGSAVDSKAPLTIVPEADLKLTNVALGDLIADAAARTSLKLTFKTIVGKNDDESESDEEELPKSTTFICALTAGKIEQTTIDIVLDEGTEYIFEVVGPNTIYLTGNYIDQVHADQDPYSDMDEDAFNLEDVSSDVEFDATGLDDDERFEEIDEAVHGSPKNLKRARDSDADKADKQLSKKQKAESGKPVKPDAPAATEKKEKKKDKKEKQKDGEKGEKTEKKAVAEREVAGGVKVKDTKIGTGPTVKKGNTVSMRYIGKLQNGKVFDSNTKGKPFTFHLGRGEVIKGWDEGIVGMQVGGERLLTIPPGMGYGKKGTDGIPGNSTLIFECKLTDFK